MYIITLKLLTLQHIELWVLYIMYFRPDDADWVAVSPFFNTMLLNREMPLYYADGVTYGVPWFAQSVRKVITYILFHLIFIN